MRIQIIDGSTRFSGGRRMLLLHANELVRRGHEVTLWVERNEPLDWLTVRFPIRPLAGASLRRLPVADVCLFQRWRFAGPVWKARRGIPVHFCQGFEGTDAENRLRALWTDPWRRLPELWKRWRRLRRLEQAYRTPTAKIVVHAPLRELMAQRFGQAAHLVPYGLDESVFHAGTRWAASGAIVLVVGPWSIRWKRLADAIEAVRLLKRRRPDVRLVRVSPEPIGDAERASGLVDEYHTMLTPVQMAEQYRRAAVLLIASDATEGFGLPALEAMACGTPTVLTDIPSFRAFATLGDFTRFVPVGEPDAMAAALEHVLNDPAVRANLQRRGLEVAAQYTMARSYAAMSAALAAIVEAGAARQRAS